MDGWIDSWIDEWMDRQRMIERKYRQRCGRQRRMDSYR